MLGASWLEISVGESQLLRTWERNPPMGWTTSYPGIRNSMAEAEDIETVAGEFSAQIS